VASEEGTPLSKFGGPPTHREKMPIFRAVGFGLRIGGFRKRQSANELGKPDFY
jgi:hypothetical protein